MRALSVWIALVLVAALLSLDLVVQRLGQGPLDHALLLYGVLPRIATAILAGAALGLAGALMQGALDNPLAEPSTLGVFAGAQLALAVAATAAPTLSGVGREAAAFLGGAGAAAVVLALGWRRRLDPMTVVLCGMIVAMIASALSATLIVAEGDYLFALLIWGGGSLVQDGWRSAGALGLVGLACGGAAFALARPLTLLVAGEDSARSLGAPVAAIRLAALGVGVLLTTAVAAEIGLIAFVGLAAPTLVRLSGARRTGQTLLAAPLVGAVLLWLTDGVVQHLGDGDAIPTGAATAVLGAPLLLWMLPRLKMADRPASEASPRRARPRRLIAFAALAGASVGLALVVGHGPQGWSVAGVAELLPFRWPRALAAFSAGAMLGSAGMILQRLTGNPLAGPEVLGVGAGAGVGLAVVTLAAGAVTATLELSGAALGALVALGAMLAVSGGGRLGPERMLLAGAAISALCLAGLNAVIATGSRTAFALLAWMTGATDAVGPERALVAAACAALLTPLAALTLRWLAILPMGSLVAVGLGLALPAVRLALTALAALMTAAAVLIVGPLSFVGLVAPHMTRAAGLTRPSAHLAGSALAGGALLTLADLMARTMIAPYQLPLGLFASLFGGGYLMFALAGRR